MPFLKKIVIEIQNIVFLSSAAATLCNMFAVTRIRVWLSCRPWKPWSRLSLRGRKLDMPMDGFTIWWQPYRQRKKTGGTLYDHPKPIDSVTELLGKLRSYIFLFKTKRWSISKQTNKQTNKQTHPAPGFCPHITNHCKILKSIQIIKKCSCARVFRQCPYLLRIKRIWGNALHLSLFLFCTNLKQLYTILRKTYNLHEKTQNCKTNIKLLKIDIKSLKTHESIKKHKKNIETHENT